jgi:hypothetical protein
MPHVSMMARRDSGKGSGLLGRRPKLSAIGRDPLDG